jgi:phospholipid/cholesterol/gamma-HCH transport system substrate-binding protein
VTRSLSRGKALVLGVVVLVGVALLGGGLFAVGSLGWFDRGAFPLRASFKQVGGVEKGTRVRVQGIDAGEVVRVEPPERPGDPVVVHMKLRGDYRHLVRSNAVVQLVSDGLIGGKVINVLPGPGDGPEVADNALLIADEGPRGSVDRAMTDAALYDEAVGLVRDARRLVNKAEQELGGVKEEAVDLARDTRRLVNKAEQDLGAMKQEMGAVKQELRDTAGRVPLMGRYVENPLPLLVRPRHERDRQVLAVTDLFERPDSAVLTPAGKKKLDGLADWLKKTKHKGSDVVVVAYADPAGGSTPTAKRYADEQAAAVRDYLVEKHSADWMGWTSWRRKVTPLGMGAEPPPEPEPRPLPPGRVEVQAFWPKG